MTTQDAQARANTLVQESMAISGAAPQQQQAATPIGGYLAPPELVRMTSGVGNFQGYYDGDEYAMLRGLPTEVLVQLQQQMVALGLTSSVIPGEYDTGTVRGFSSLLALANTKRERWQQTVARMARSPEEGGLALAAQKDKQDNVYLPPDYDSLLFAAKDAIKDRLRRDATDAEMAVLADKMLASYRAQFDAGVAGMPEDTGTGKTVVGPAQVDPQSQFRKHFESRYSGEIESVERDDSYAKNQDSARTVLDSFGSLIGGG